MRIARHGGAGTRRSSESTGLWRRSLVGPQRRSLAGPRKCSLWSVGLASKRLWGSAQVPLGSSPQALLGPVRKRVWGQPTIRSGPRECECVRGSGPVCVMSTMYYQATFGSGLENSAGGMRHQQGGWQRLLQGTSVDAGYYVGKSGYFGGVGT